MRIIYLPRGPESETHVETKYVAYLLVCFTVMRNTQTRETARFLPGVEFKVILLRPYMFWRPMEHGRTLSLSRALKVA